MVGFIIKIILNIYKNIISICISFIKTIISLIYTYTWPKIILISTLLASFLTIRHTNIGLFLKCKNNTIYNNDFKKDSKVLITNKDKVIVNVKENVLKKISNT